jgi:hypothetical protein
MVMDALNAPFGTTIVPLPVDVILLVPTSYNTGFHIPFFFTYTSLQWRHDPPFLI